MKSYIDDSDLFNFIFTLFCFIRSITSNISELISLLFILEVGDMAKIITKQWNAFVTTMVLI